MNLPFKAGDVRNEGLIPGSGIPAVGSGNSLQYACLENSMDKGAWWEPMGAAKSQIGLSTTFQLCTSLNPHPFFLEFTCSQFNGSTRECITNTLNYIKKRLYKQQSIQRLAFFFSQALTTQYQVFTGLFRFITARFVI